MKFVLLFAAFFGSLSANANEQLVCQSQCKGNHARILFKKQIYAGLGYIDAMVDFKIKCRDQGGVVDSGRCGPGDGAEFGISDTYCVVYEEVTATGRGRSVDDLIKARGQSIDRCYDALNVKPECEQYAGVESITITSTDCKVEGL